MKRFYYLLTAITLISFSACKKEPTRHCWQIIDNLGNHMNLVCDKTESELLACLNNNTCGVSTGFAITNCNYFIAEGESFCWMINGHYYKNMNENELTLYRNCFGLTGTAEKVTCGYCQYWFTRQKQVYKPTSSIRYSYITKKQYCGDTLNTIFQGRQIIIKDDADSLISIQFSDNGADW